MRTRSRIAAVPVAAVMVAVLAGCADRSEVTTFTDEHGRACTATVVIDGDDRDKEATTLDCEYPPAGRTPGPTTQRPLPKG
jgi:hypothetical protein